MIKDVVERVKCELSEAFDRKTEQLEFQWLADWTAKVDITLTINDTAGVTPSGSYTAIQKNGINFEAGPSSFPATLARSIVPQFLTLGANATLNSQANRTETLSFTLALDELKRWRRELDIEESNPAFPPEKRTCYLASQTGLTGNLGLQEWVESAFYPVKQHVLKAGIHPSPLTQKAGGAPAATTSPEKKEAVEVYTYKLIHDNLAKWQDELKKTSDQVDVNQKAIEGDAWKVQTAFDSLYQKVGKFEPVLEEYLKKRFAPFVRLMKQYEANAKVCLSRVNGYKNSLDRNSKRIRKLLDKIPKDKADDVKSVVESGIEAEYKEIDNNVVKIQSGNYISNSETCKTSTATDAANADAIDTKAVPNAMDPPVNSVLHSLMFVVTYGGGVSPSWTLIQWKGPALNGSMASVQGMRTHSLQIALGPRSGKPMVGEDPLRLLQLNAIRGNS